MKRIKILCLMVISLFACTKENMQINEKECCSSNIIAVSSTEELFDRIMGGDNLQTKSTEEILPANLFNQYSEVDVENDPILSFEVGRSACKKNNTLYKLLGYDELVPNENFARLLNTHGEIQVGETVYKISPRGTYYFPVSEIELFESISRIGGE